MAGSKRRGSSSGGSPGMFSRKGTAPAPAPTSAPRQMPPPTVSSSLPQKLPPQSSTASAARPTPTATSSPMAPTSAPHGSAPHGSAPQGSFPPRAPGAPGAYPQAPMGSMPMGGMPMGGMPMGGQPSMMRSIISSAIGSAVGVTAAHSLMNAFSSGDKEQIAQISQQEQGGKCGNQFQTFLQCLQANSSNVNNCQWASDMLNQCKASE